MTKEQEKHLQTIVKAACVLISAKYRAGAASHTDSLTDKTELELAEEIVMETVDQLVYGLTLINKIKNNDRGRDVSKGLPGEGVREEPKLPQVPVRSVRDIPSNENLY